MGEMFICDVNLNGNLILISHVLFYLPHHHDGPQQISHGELVVCRAMHLHWRALTVLCAIAPCYIRNSRHKPSTPVQLSNPVNPEAHRPITSPPARSPYLTVKTDAWCVEAVENRSVRKCLWVKRGLSTGIAQQHGIKDRGFTTSCGFTES